MVSFLDHEGTDPSSASREAAEAITKARREVESKGIKSFLFHSSSPEEFDQRAEFSGVSEVLDEIADEYLGSPDQRAKLTAALRREFVGNDDPMAEERRLYEVQHGFPDSSNPAPEQDDGEECTCAIGGESPLAHSPLCAKMRDSTQGKLWRKEIQPGHGVVAEKETVHLDSGDVEIEKGKLTKQVGGKPSEHMDKVRELAENGNKGAQFYLNVLSKQAGRFAVCPTCEGQGSHVNPSIDSQGLGAEDFDEDPDFAEDYFSGAYDIRCAECGGDRVVPGCSDCGEPALAKDRSGSSDRRDRVSTEHYDKCYDHLDPDDKEDHDDLVEMYAEMAAEQRMGA